MGLILFVASQKAEYYDNDHQQQKKVYCPARQPYEVSQSPNDKQNDDECVKQVVHKVELYFEAKCELNPPVFVAWR